MSAQAQPQYARGIAALDSRRPALKDQPEYKKITIYIRREVDAALENVCQERMLKTGEGAHQHTKSGLINEVLIAEFMPSFGEFSDYFPTEQRLRNLGLFPAHDSNAPDLRARIILGREDDIATSVIDDMRVAAARTRVRPPSMVTND